MNGKDRAIAFQNATSAAAVVYAGLYDGGKPFDVSEFDKIRDGIFAWSEERLAYFYAQDSLGVVPGTGVVTPIEQVPSGPGLAPVAQIPTDANLAAQQAAHPGLTAPGGLAPLPGVGAPEPDKEELWKHLFQNPNDWYDNREDKRSGKSNARGPDFKRKVDKTALWITSKDTPPWVTDQIGTK